jgi:hypothetical protein
VYSNCQQLTAAAAGPRRGVEFSHNNAAGLTFFALNKTFINAPAVMTATIALRFFPTHSPRIKRSCYKIYGVLPRAWNYF